MYHNLPVWDLVGFVIIIVDIERMSIIDDILDSYLKCLYETI